MGVVNVLSRPRHRYLTKLSCFAWGLPLLTTIVGLLVEQFSEKHDGYTMRFSQLEYLDKDKNGINVQFYVWLEYEIFLGTIIVPFAFTFLFNTIMFGMVMVALMNSQNPLVTKFRRISRHLSRQNSQHAIKTSKELELQKTKKIKDTRRTVQGAIALLVILGVTYIFMFFMLNEMPTKEVVAYFFVIFNALQGFWIFMFHTLLKDDVLPMIICPGYVRKKKLEKKMSNSTENTNSRENSGELYPSGGAYITKPKKINRIEHSPTMPSSEGSNASTNSESQMVHGKLQFTKSLPAMPLQKRNNVSLQRQVQFRAKK